MRIIKYISLVILIVFNSCHDKGKEQTSVIKNNLQVQKYPLITIDPNISAWSETSTLYSSQVKHSSGRTLPLVGLIRVDGKVYRFMGTEELQDEAIAGTSCDSEWTGKYTFIHPDKGWMKWNFDDREWNSGKAPFGTKSAYQVNTIWPSPGIWVRRKIKINQDEILNKKLYLKYSHDDVLEIYINGILLVKTGYEWKKNEIVEIPDEVKRTIKDNEIIIAAHCKNLQGGALLDFGVYLKNVDDEWFGRYTFVQPPEDWQKEHFDDCEWDRGKAPFGTPTDYHVNTNWKTSDIWVRREINIHPALLKKTLILKYSHDDEFELYINGVQIVKTGFDWKQNEIIEIPDRIKKMIKDGKITIAAHCKNKRGGALVDFVLYGEDIASQESVDVQATRTSYLFKCGNVELRLRFIAPLLLDDIEVMSRPINYISYDVTSLDKKKHHVEIYFEITPAWASNGTIHTNTSELYTEGNLLFLKTGRKVQKVFEPNEKYMQINWGYFYMCANGLNTTSAMGDATKLRKEFISKGCLSAGAKSYAPASYIALAQSLGNSKQVSGKIMIGYDDVYSIQYFGENLHPYWNRKGNKKIEQLFSEADRDYDSLVKKCQKFDHEFRRKTTLEKGMEYADFLALTYRQIVTENKLDEGPSGDLLFFSRGRPVDINHLSSLLLNNNTELLKALLNPIFYYSESNKWEKNYPPSNIGEYPLENGETSSLNGAVEAASDLLILTAAIMKADGNTDYATKHWDILTKWNNYLSEINADMYNQLSYGISVHNQSDNSEIASKIMLGMSSYGYMAKFITMH